MCILLYVKLIWWYSGGGCFPEIYAWCLIRRRRVPSSICGVVVFSLLDMGICAFFYLWNLFGVVVFQRSMLDWRRGWGQSAIGICAFFYMWNLFGVVVFQWGQICHRYMLDWDLGLGVGSVCYRYKCILLSVKLIWCSCFPGIYAWLEEGVGSVCYRYKCILLSVKLIWCSCFPEIYAWLEEGMRSVCHSL